MLNNIFHKLTGNKTVRNSIDTILIFSFVIFIIFMFISEILLNQCFHFHVIPHSDFLKLLRSDIPYTLSVFGPQPKQRFLFMSFVFLTPFYCLAALFLSDKLLNFIKKKFSTKNFEKFRISVNMYFGVISFCIVIYVLQNSLFLFLATTGILDDAVIIFILLLCITGIVVLFCTDHLRLLFAYGQKTVKIFTIVFIVIGVLGILFHTFSIRLFNFQASNYYYMFKNDLEPLYYSLTQIMSGKKLLVDLYTQYGFYSLILLPIFKLIGLSLFKFSLAMNLLEVVSFLLLFYMLYRFTNSFLLATLFILTLCCIGGGIFYVVLFHGVNRFSPFYQYWPLRIIFPSISLLCFWLLAKEVTLKKTIIFSLVSAVAIIWNIETGVIITAAFFSYYLCLCVFPVFSKKRFYYLKCFIVALTTVILILSVFVMYLELSGHFQLHWSWVLKIPHLFFVFGVSQLPVPVALNLWMIVLSVYIVGILYAFFNWFKRNNNYLISCIFYISILGIGLFSYYQNRAHIFNLMAVSWPAIMLNLVFANIVFTEIKNKHLSINNILFVFPGCFFCVTIALIYIYSIPILLDSSKSIWQKILVSSPYIDNNLMHEYNFIKQQIQASKNAVILLEDQALLYGELGLASDLQGPSINEIFLQSDYDALTQQLLLNVSPNVFIDCGDKRMSALGQKYNIQKRSSENICYLIPKILKIEG